MIIVYNNFIPFKGFDAMCIYPFIFVRKDAQKFNDVIINHEKIHGAQQVETFVASAVVLTVMSLVFKTMSPWWIAASPLVYFLLYNTEFSIRLALYDSDDDSAYRNISFEQEAYVHQADKEYLRNRRPFASWKYLFRKTY